MSWGKRIIAGTTYDLTHLDSFNLPVLCGNRGFRLQVSFGAHSFTRKPRDGDTPDLTFMDGKTQRTFCVYRYAHSLHLPAAIAAAVQGDVLKSREAFALSATLPGLEGPYLVIFDLRKTNARRLDGKLHVRSAHHRPELEANLPRAKFTAVVTSVMNQRTIRWR